MREILIRPRAQLDLESIFIHIGFELGSPDAAQATLEALYNTFELIADMPTLGMSFESADLERSYRRKLVKNYWVYYSFDEANVIIWRVFHTRQDIDTQTLVSI